MAPYDSIAARVAIPAVSLPPRVPMRWSARFRALRGVVSGPVVVVWLALAVVTTLPYAWAALAPPPGSAFAGTFHWIDDFHNYVSFVQQAEDGRFVFENKLLLSPHEPTLVNLEYWVVGRISRLCGRRPFLAYRLFALIALAGLLSAADRALRRGGLPASHRLPALLLVCVGGGLGGLLFELTPRPAFRCADLSMGLFPFIEILSNPHWLAGTWLLLESLLAFSDISMPRHWLVAGLLGSTLALVRPYDFVILLIVQASAAALAPPRAWLAGGLPLLTLAPAVLYNYWAFYVSPTFATYAATPYAMPPSADFLLGLGPAALLALLSLVGPADPQARALRVRLWVWALLAVVMILARPVMFAQQFTIGSGLPLLVLAALGLSRARPRTTAMVALLCSSTGVVALRVVLRSEPHWHVPAERRDAALALRAVCRPGAVVLAPADIGLYTIGLTACRAYVSHRWAPAFAEHQTLVNAFYGPTAPAVRATLLDRWGIVHLVLPGDPGTVPVAWLGEGSPFQRVARVGSGDRTISIYSREPLSSTSPSGRLGPGHARPRAAASP